MKRTHFLLIMLGLIGVILCPVLTGCGHAGTDSTMSPQDEKLFKGGPMPEAAKRGMAEDAARQAQLRNAAANGTPPPAKP